MEPSDSVGAADDRGERLTELRGAVDRVDQELVGLLADRIRLTQEIGAFKDTHGTPVRISEREECILDQVRATAAVLGVDPAAVVTVFEAMLSTSRAAQHGARVVGPDQPVAI